MVDGSRAGGSEVRAAGPWGWFWCWALICGYGYLATNLATDGGLPPGQPVRVAAVAALPLVCHAAVRRFALHTDPLILSQATLFSGLGLVLIHRLDIAYTATYGSAAAPGQLRWCGIAVAVFAGAVMLFNDHRSCSGTRI